MNKKERKLRKIIREEVQKLIEMSGDPIEVLYDLCDHYEDKYSRMALMDKRELIEMLEEFTEKFNKRAAYGEVSFSMSSGGPSGVPMRAPDEKTITINVHLDGSDMAGMRNLLVSNQLYYSKILGRLRRASSRGIKVK